MGLTHSVEDTSHIEAFNQVLESKFNISPWLLLVPVITGVLIAKKAPSLVTLFVSTIAAGICALIFQPELLHEIANEINEGTHTTFKGLMMTFYGSTSLDAGDTAVNQLISTRGMAGMLNTIWLIICAMCFGGAMTASGMIGSLTAVFVKKIRRTVTMVSSTVFAGISLNLITADQYISIVLTGNMFNEIYKKEGYESCLLSRTTEDAVTVTSVLIPWNTCGMTQATILNVSTLTYLPYCFFNLLSPIMSIIVAAIGYKIRRFK